MTNINKTELEYFSDSLYRSPNCSDDFENGMKHRAKKDALTKKYIGLNRTYRHYIVIDLDIAGSAWIWEEKNLPPPSIIAVNPKNSHAHYFYRLNTPVYFSAGGRKHPQDFYAAIKDQLNTLLGGDTAYAGAVAKNPFHDAWKVLTFPKSYDLKDFKEWFVNENEISKTPKVLDEKFGRNEAIFKSLSEFAHAEYKNISGPLELFEKVENQASLFNEKFKIKLSEKELAGIVKSVSKGVYKWRQAHPSKSLSDETLATLQSHATALKTAGQKPTQFAIACASGISQKTVHKYLKKIVR